MMGRHDTPDLFAASQLIAYPLSSEPLRSRRQLGKKSSKTNSNAHGSASKENVGDDVENDPYGSPSGGRKSGFRKPGERRIKNIVFYRNGDKFYQGKKVRITPHRYLTFTELLTDLTKSVSLPYGVRRIYTPTGDVIDNIDDLEDGKSYVCASFERFKQQNYGTKTLPDWSSNIKKTPLQDKQYPIGRLSLGYSYPLSGKYAGAYAKATNDRLGGSVPGTFAYHGQKERGGQPSDSPVKTFGRPSDANKYKPRLLKFIKYGARPRKTISILLNKRNVFSFEHLLNEITDAFDLPVHKNKKVRKIYTTKGREIRSVSDFFRETDSIFIAAVGRQPLLKVEIEDILEEIFPTKLPGNDEVVSPEGPKPKRRFRDKDSKSDSGVETDALELNQSVTAELPPLKTTRKGNKVSNSKKSPSKETKIKAKAWASPDEREADEKRIAAEEQRRREEAAQRKKEEAERKEKEEEQKKKEEELRKQEEEKERKKREEDKKAELARKEAELKEKEEELRIKEEESKRKEEERKKKEAEEKQKRKEEKAKKKEEEKKIAEEEKRKEEERKKKDDEIKKKKEEEEKLKEEQAKQKEEDERKEEQRKEKEEKIKKKKEEEKLKKQKQTEEEEKKKRKEEENSKKLADDDDNDSRFDLPAEDSLTLTIASEDAPVEAVVASTTSPDAGLEDNELDTKTADDVKTDEPDENRFVPAPREIVNKNIILEKYDVGKKIGDGNFAEVHKSILKSSKEPFAMKIVYKSKLKGKEHMIANEIGIMHNISHKNIVRLYEEYETKNHIYLLMEFVSGGDLFDAITESVKFTEADGATIIGDMAKALGYLHDLNIVHRDLKPENILVSKSSSGDIMVKLADFGLAMEVKEPIFTVCGTPTYVAPEILAETGYGLEVDMWATGVITYILLCGFPPFRSLDRDQEELFELIQAGNFEFISPYWDNISFDAKDLINHLLVVNPKRRFKSHQVLRHPWIMNHNKSENLPNIQREVSMNLEMNFEGRKSRASASES